MRAETKNRAADITGTTGSYWLLTVASPENLMPLETAIDGLCAPDALSIEVDSHKMHRLQVWFHTAPDSRLIDDIAARALSRPEQADIQLEFIPEHDWLAENRKSFPPLTIGCFWIYGSHVTAPAPKTLLPILIDAAQAFGSGTHPTTEGCLRALSAIRRQKHCPQKHWPQKILDMGCGSAILAIAASHLFPGASVMAADNDAISVRTAAENRRLNNIAPRQMKTVLSAGFSNRAVAKNGAYDVILANILARPLRLMAADLTRHLAPHGQLILSGLLTSQVNWVMQAYLPRGMRLKRHIIIGDWSCLVLVSRRKKGAV